MRKRQRKKNAIALDKVRRAAFNFNKACRIASLVIEEHTMLLKIPKFVPQVVVLPEIIRIRGQIERVKALLYDPSSNYIYTAGYDAWLKRRELSQH